MINDERVTITGCNTRVLTVGDGPNNILFLHGVGARADRWTSTMTAVAAVGRRLSALDFPGHGYACKGHLSVSVFRLAEFVNAAFDAADIDHAVVVGTSLGGHVAARLFLDHPDRVDALVLVGSLGLAPIGPDGTKSIAERMVRLDREGVRTKLLHAAFDPAMVTDAWVDEEHAFNNSPGARESLTAYARYFRDHIDNDTVGDELVARAAGASLTLVWGEADRTVPLAIAEQFAARCPTAQLHVIRGAAHQPYLEQPDAFGAALRAALDRVRC